MHNKNVDNENWRSASFWFCLLIEWYNKFQYNKENYFTFRKIYLVCPLYKYIDYKRCLAWFRTQMNDESWSSSDHSCVKQNKKVVYGYNAIYFNSKNSM
jgi:hypothetical protein